jgi:hypothetical protein
MSERIPVILCIDVEPDLRRPDPTKAAPWWGFERLYPYLRELRPRMADASGEAARLNWFWRLDPQVEMVYGSAEWALRQYEAEVAETVLAGDEHGVHPHAWRWDATLHGWVPDYGNPSWVEHCVVKSFTVFRSVFGKACESVRIGDRYFDDRVRGILERLGCRFDLTVEPGEKPARALAVREGYTGSVPDYRSVEMGPYRPPVEDFRKRDEDRSEGLWIIPLASGVMSGRGLRWRRYLRRQWSSMGPIPTGYGTLRLWEPPELVQPAIEETLERLERPYLAFAIRSDVLLNPWWGGNCRRNLELLLQRAQSRRLVFCTPRDSLRAMGLLAERAVATVIDETLRPPLEHPRLVLPTGVSLPVPPHGIGQFARPE